MTKSRIFFYFCLSFIGGIFLNSLIQIPQLLMLGFLILAIFSISIFWNYPAGKPSASNGAGKKLVVIGFCISFLVLGIWRHQVAEIQISKSKLQIYTDKEEIITLLGMVASEPDIRQKRKKLKISIKEIQWGENRSRPIDGQVLVTAIRYPEYRYGDKLKITGFLKTPQNFEEGEEDKSSSSPFAVARDFNYKDYLKKDGIYSVTDWPKIELLEREKYIGVTYAIYGEILKFKNKLRESIYQNLSPPQSSILGALILGDKRQISPEWNQKLNYTGVRHITAVSGLHVAILTSILMSFLIGIGFWRKQAFYFAIILIALFIVLTGLQPSAIRAGIMGGLFLFAQYLGRLNVSSRAIVLAAAVMLIQNPLLLKLDVGFQLSFLAMLGMIYLTPVSQNWLRGISDFLQLKNILAMTLSAQIFTLPILIYNFGYFSLVAPITNILILPFLPYIMGLGFLFAIAGLIWQPLGWIFSLPVWLLLTYLTKVIDWFSGFSFAAYTTEISWVWLVISYLILGFLTWWINKKFTRPSFL